MTTVIVEVGVGEAKSEKAEDGETRTDDMIVEIGADAKVWGEVDWVGISEVYKEEGGAVDVIEMMVVEGGRGGDETV